MTDPVLIDRNELDRLLVMASRRKLIKMSEVEEMYSVSGTTISRLEKKGVLRGIVSPHFNGVRYSTVELDKVFGIKE